MYLGLPDVQEREAILKVHTNKYVRMCVCVHVCMCDVGRQVYLDAVWGV